MGGSPSLRRECLLVVFVALVLSCYGEYVSLAEACGDGRLDPGELCDDHNDVEGDGCNNDCTASATEQWTRCIESFPHPDVRANGVSFDREGNPVLLATIVSEEGGDAKVWTRSFDQDGAVLWTSVCCDEPGSDYVASAAGGPVVSADGGIVIGGRITGGAMNDASLVLSLGGDGDLLWQAEPTELEPVAAITALATDRVFALVERGGEPVLLGLGAKSWSRAVAAASAGTFTARALELDGTAALYAAGVIDEGPAKGCGWLGRYGNDGGQFFWQAEDGDARYLDVAVDPSAGRVYALAMAPCSGAARTTVHRYDASGLRSSDGEFPAPRLDATGLGLAVDGAGRLTILAEEAAGPTLTRIAADSTMLWTAAVPGLAAQVLAVAPTGRIAVGGIQQKGGKVDVCLRTLTP